AVLLAAGVVGIAGDALLRVTPWGLNAPVWMAIFALAFMGVARSQRIALSGGGRWLLAPALFFAAGIAWRDSPALNVLAGAAALLALAIAAFRTRAGSV